MRLSLHLNKIGPQGTLYLANALRENQVIIHSSHHFIRLYADYCAQTLTRLNLHYNQIGDEGAKHLADALQHNKVHISILLLFRVL